MKTASDRQFKREAGFLLLALIFIILILGVVAYAFVNITSSHRMAISDAGRSIKTLYIREAALEIGQEYVATYYWTAYWADHTDPIQPWQPICINQALGDGQFSVSFAMTNLFEPSPAVDFLYEARVDE